MGDTVGAAVDDTVGAAVGNTVSAVVDDSVDSAVGDAVDAAVGDSARLQSPYASSRALWLSPPFTQLSLVHGNADISDVVDLPKLRCHG